MCYIDPTSFTLKDKIMAWKLIEYRAVLLVHADILVIRNPSQLFTLHYSQMLAEKKSLGAVTRSMCSTGSQKQIKGKPSTAVLLLTPSTLTYLKLKKFTISHANETNPTSNLQSAVHHLFVAKQDLLYELPPEYNSNVAWKFCNAHWWNRARISILHFTLVKPWSLLSTNLLNFGSLHPWACWASGLSDLCGLWANYYHYYYHSY